MLRRERDVLEAGESGESGPLFRLVALRVEGAGQDVKETIDVVRRGADQRMRDHAAECAINAPVDKQTQAAIAKKLHGGGIICPAGSLPLLLRRYRLLRPIPRGLRSDKSDN